MPQALSVLTATVDVERPPERPPLPDPSPTVLNDIEWSVFTNEVPPQEDRWVFFGLSPDQYELLSKNQAEMLRWVIEAKWRLRYYRGEEQDTEEIAE